MGIEIKTEEQYVLITVRDENASKEFCEELKDTISNQMENGAKNFILDMSSIREVSEDFNVSMDTIMNILQKEDGILVITGAEEGDIRKLIENKGIVTTRILDEAVDYVFMEEIEKQLHSGLDEESEDI